MLYLMLLDYLLSFPGSIHFICSSFLGFLSYLNAIGTVLCALEHPGEIHMTVTKWCRLCISCEALRRGRSLDTSSI